MRQFNIHLMIVLSFVFASVAVAAPTSAPSDSSAPTTWPSAITPSGAADKATHLLIGTIKKVEKESIVVSGKSDNDSENRTYTVHVYPDSKINISMYEGTFHDLADGMPVLITFFKSKTHPHFLSIGVMLPGQIGVVDTISNDQIVVQAGAEKKAIKLDSNTKVRLAIYHPKAKIKSELKTMSLADVKKGMRVTVSILNDVAYSITIAGGVQTGGN